MKVLIFKDIKNKRWTIWNEKRTKHIGYDKELTLIDTKLIVIESKRKLVNKTKQRFPHAWIIGKLIKKKSTKLKNNITYNPFKNKHFLKNNKKIKTSKKVSFNKDMTVSSI